MLWETKVCFFLGLFLFILSRLCRLDSFFVSVLWKLSQRTRLWDDWKQKTQPASGIGSAAVQTTHLGSGPRHGSPPAAAGIHPTDETANYLSCREHHRHACAAIRQRLLVDTGDFI